MSRPIREMRNLGPRCEEMLAAIGINNESQFREVGAAVAYRELVAAGVTRHHRMLLYALGGAIANEDCLRLPAELKRELEAEAGIPPRKRK
ncbi:MAG: TfoX/Sxy family DNA transformation protein [Verrucomicrobiales bacterium]